MTHVISQETKQATVTKGRYIATIDGSGQNVWTPHDGSTPVLHPRDLGYVTCERTDVEVNGVTYEGYPQNTQHFTVGKLVPLQQVSDDQIHNKELAIERGATHAIDFSGRGHRVYDERDYGTVVDESTVTRHDPYADKE